MKFQDLQLPSNRRFGFFFTFIFAVVAIYLYDPNAIFWTLICGLASLIFVTFTLVYPVALLPLNKLWMRFGFLLGMIVGPIVLGVVFFGLFTSIAIFMRLIGRDELRLNFRNKPTYWISRSDTVMPESFKNQF